MVKAIILMRHAEREDRAQEQKGLDWISTAPRPQDPELSDEGFQQARLAGQQMKEIGITKILSSPMIRTVQTSNTVADQIGLGENSICVETGLVEEAKSFRGKTAAEPRPNWNPLVLPVKELTKFSNRINTEYVPLLEVQHVRDDSIPNTIREVHDTLTERDEVTRDRCKTALLKILSADDLKDEVVLCVGHGATVKAMAMVLESQLPEEHKIAGERTVSCFAEFRPVDPSNPLGPWRSVKPEWGTGDFEHIAAEVLEDRGLSCKDK
jgi:broad specificity phosphatase PhoE